MNVITLRACTDCKLYCFCSISYINIIVTGRYHCYQIWCCYALRWWETLNLAACCDALYVFIYKRLFERWILDIHWAKWGIPGDCWFVDLNLLWSSATFLCFIYKYTFKDSESFAELKIKSLLNGVTSSQVCFHFRNTWDSYLTC